jgi:CheY-like chemotaxis protein
MPSETYSVLIIDDDSFLLDMYSFKFKDGGHTVEVALGADEALAKLRAGLKPDVVLCDVVMPGMDGFQLLELIKKEHLAEGSIIIVLSNRGERADLDRGRALGVDAYIVKAQTIPSEVLEQVLKTVRERRGGK